MTTFHFEYALRACKIPAGGVGGFTTQLLRDRQLALPVRKPVQGRVGDGLKTVPLDSQIVRRRRCGFSSQEIQDLLAAALPILYSRSENSELPRPSWTDFVEFSVASLCFAGRGSDITMLKGLLCMIERRLGILPESTA
jgi:hypothetical protein